MESKWSYSRIQSVCLINIILTLNISTAIVVQSETWRALKVPSSQFETSTTDPIAVRDLIIAQKLCRNDENCNLICEDEQSQLFLSNLVKASDYYEESDGSPMNLCYSPPSSGSFLKIFSNLHHCKI